MSDGYDVLHHSALDTLEAYDYLLAQVLLHLAFALPKEDDSDESPFLRTLRGGIEEDIANPRARETASGILAVAELRLKRAVDQSRASERAVDDSIKEWRLGERKLDRSRTQPLAPREPE